MTEKLRASLYIQDVLKLPRWVGALQLDELGYRISKVAIAPPASWSIITWLFATSTDNQPVRIALSIVGHGVRYPHGLIEVPPRAGYDGVPPFSLLEDSPTAAAQGIVLEQGLELEFTCQTRLSPFCRVALIYLGHFEPLTG